MPTPYGGPPQKLEARGKAILSHTLAIVTSLHEIVRTKCSHISTRHSNNIMPYIDFCVRMEHYA